MAVTSRNLKRKHKGELVAQIAYKKGVEEGARIVAQRIREYCEERVDAMTAEGYPFASSFYQDIIDQLKDE